MIEDSKRPQPRFNGMADAIKKIVAEEGVGGLYRGLGPVVSTEGCRDHLVKEVACNEAQYDNR